MKIGYHAGVWDLFHAGHLSVLEASRARCDALIVGVLTDDGAAAYKPGRPVVHHAQRLQIVSGLRCVDAAFLQPGTDPTPVLDALAAVDRCPSVFFHGADWEELREGGETLDRLGIAFERLPLTEWGPAGSGRISTSAIIDRVRDLEA